MYKYYVQIGALFLVLLGTLVAFQTNAFADEVEQTEPSAPVDSTVQVHDAQLESIQATLDAILEQLTAEPSTDEQAPDSPDYTAQLSEIENTLSKVEQNTQPATPETAQNAFEKPFEEYTVQEVVSVVLFSVVIVVFLYVLVKYALRGVF